LKQEIAALQDYEPAYVSMGSMCGRRLIDVFVGTMNPAFCQTGNAVPALLARQIAAGIVDGLYRAVIPAIAAE
jgi:site-specific DNA-cytosine methylase